LSIFALQCWGSYETIRNVFRVLALVLLSYVGAAFLAHPDRSGVVTGTLIPSLRFDKDFLSLLVAIIGTSLSADLYTWQSNQEVEEEIAMGRTFIILSAAATLFIAGKNDVHTAADAAGAGAPGPAAPPACCSRWESSGWDSWRFR
jgi:hypothetical protein